MSSFGTYKTDCPVCARPLEIPIRASLAPRNGSRLRSVGAVRCYLNLDEDYMRAHALAYHGSHDGEPLPAAA